MTTVMLIIFRIVIALIGIAAVYLLVNWLFGKKKKERKENPLAERIGTASKSLSNKDREATAVENLYEEHKEIIKKVGDPEKRIEKVKDGFEGVEAEASEEEKEVESKDGKTRQPKTRKKRGTQ